MDYEQGQLSIMRTARASPVCKGPGKLDDGGFSHSPYRWICRDYIDRWAILWNLHFYDSLLITSYITSVGQFCNVYGYF